MVAQDVSRETLDRLTRYHDLLLKWNRRINLVSRSTETEIWERHIWDSAQVYDLAPASGHWMDIGSGGGFPGLVIAIIAMERNPERCVTLVESDQRKSAFLRTVIRELPLNAVVKVSRVEALLPAQTDVLSARALADLDSLLHFAERHLIKGGRALFMKGENWENEVEIARKRWSFTLDAHKSKTSPKAAILEIKELQRA